MARDSGFGTQELLKEYLPRLVVTLEQMNKNLELIAERLPKSDGQKVTSAKKK